MQRSASTCRTRGLRHRFGMKTTPLLALLLLLFPTVASAQGSPPDAAARLGAGMGAFVATLDEDQRDTALYAWEDDERFDLRLAPLGLEGLRVDEMTDAQWAELEALLGQVLSPEGIETMNTIRSRENEVKEMEGGLFGFLMDRIRLVGRYFLAVFGEPAADGVWGFRFDGHHLSMNVTAVPGRPLSATPLFFGGQPREVPASMERAGLRVLDLEEDLAVAFLNGLSDAERGRALIPWQEGSAINRPMSISGDVDLVLPPSAGLARDDVSPASRAAFDALVDALLRHFQPGIAARYRAMLRGADGPVTIQYASFADDDATPVEAGRALYYRIQGGGLSIEFDDTAEAADHIHVVYRHPENDFGRDLLGEHLASHH